MLYSLNYMHLFAAFLVYKIKPCKIIHELPMWQVLTVYSGKKCSNQTIYHHVDLKALIVAVVLWRMLSISILYTFRRNCGFLFQGVVQKTTPQKSAKIILGVLFQEEYLECFPLRKEMGSSRLQKAPVCSKDLWEQTQFWF